MKWMDLFSRKIRCGSREQLHEKRPLISWHTGFYGSVGSVDDVFWDRAVQDIVDIAEQSCACECGFCGFAWEIGVALDFDMGAFKEEQESFAIIAWGHEQCAEI